ncbi:hypothetical protein [Dyadobacter psychrotolerans]|uniref:Periplasmic heavy metal sensor n=1 Tax=Dyadobacter psychrotolerans TaxID=2541721 RepID=A0A4R5DK79_9BACT|nr:hypothetical protein [Dyadobacter psychrotolerans]TDE14566.1 hypothetical protein E0F88_15340 [Dyadobacter psychrotolerans]
MRKILFVAAILALGFTSANAQYGPRDDRRYDDGRDGHRYDNRDNNYHEYNNGRDSEINMIQREARQRISDGIRARRLSQREASVLIREYERIEGMERAFSRRGRLSNRETRILKEDLRKLMVNTHRLSDRRGDNWARGGRY